MTAMLRECPAPGSHRPPGAGLADACLSDETQAKGALAEQPWLASVAPGILEFKCSVAAHPWLPGSKNISGKKTGPRKLTRWS